MEFLDEYESRPRFLFHSKHSPSQPDHSSSSSSSSSASSLLSSLHKPALFVSLSISLLLLTLAFLYFNFEPLKSLLLWLALSLLLGPFAPSSLTAGDVRVGLGPPLKEEETPNNSIDSIEKSARKSTKTRKKILEDAAGFSEKPTVIDGSLVDSPMIVSDRRDQSSSGNKSSVEKHEDQSEWREADDELLRKLMGKHPVGKPGRWEAIAEVFKGRYRVDTIISKAKEMGDRKVSDQDSFKKFLKDRKPVDKRLVLELDGGGGGNERNGETGSVDLAVGKKESGWTGAEDLALLNALKTFPKDVAMRWEKIAASVPGKTKAACMKRVTELKKDFRSSKASS